MRRVLQIIWRPVLLSAWLVTIGLSASAQSPEVLKVEPPSWWAGSSINPVRLLIRGRNLKGAGVTTSNAALRAGPVKVNPAGTYLFVDVSIGRLTKPGNYRLQVTTTNGSADANFEILQPLSRFGHFQGFSIDD